MTEKTQKLKAMMGAISNIPLGQHSYVTRAKLQTGFGFFLQNLPILKQKKKQCLCLQM